MNVFEALKKERIEHKQAVWAVSWVSGMKYDHKRKQMVHTVTELTVVGTHNMRTIAQGQVAYLIGQGGMHPYQAAEAVQVKRAGWLH